MNEILERYTAVTHRITQAAQRAGRNPNDITLVAVTKTWPAETVLAAYEAGMRQFGENRPEELAEKRTAVESQLGPDNGITWHLIGTLQSRKTSLAADHADVFHALDRLKIANRLSSHLLENRRLPENELSSAFRPLPSALPVFLEVNVSGEASKSGWDMRKWENSATQRDNLRNAAETIAGLPGLHLVGLMTMAPWDAPEAEIRSVFRRTRELSMWLDAEIAVAQITQLSMGMTDDFEIAIEEGATHIRVGRAIFGSRT
ncbi:MAG: YggS family pyridoxal phosphate-dependent enzyme [Ardenticatenaceae bacterium]|nr:YggS family pyridoxal phosphate-dependent enzyme [Ardenticatenaceae bacterium]MCB9443066.1 YggS family pyridoxal phosphate-dependent enzyme [Ardenticatenaceae bacterium]